MGLLRVYARDDYPNHQCAPLKRHDDLAEMLVGFHVLERLADVSEGEHLVDRQLQLAGFDRAPDVLPDLVEDLADFLDGAGAEGDADIGDAARGMQVEIEFGAAAAEPADIDDAALDLGGGEVLVGDLARDLVDDQVDAFAVRRLQHLVDPAGVGGIHREIGAEFLQASAPHFVGGRSDHQRSALELGDLHRHQADAGTGALDQYRLARLQRAVGDDRVVHGGEGYRQGGGLLEIHVGGRAEQPAVIGQRVFREGRAAGAHDLVADLDALGLRPELGDFAGPFHAEHGADAAGRAMDMALGHAQISTVEAAGVDLDQHLGAFRRGFWNVGNGSAAGAVDIGLHAILSFCRWCETAYSAASRWAPDIMSSSRLRMMVSASRMMRDTSSAQVGIS